MYAKDIATPHVVQADATQSLRDAARILYRHQVSCLVVTSKHGREKVPVGMITDRDIATATLLEGKNADSTAIASTMSRPPVICRSDSTLTEVIAIMRGSGLRRLPVVDGNGALVGIVAADDVIAAMAELMENLARALIVDPQLDRAYR